MEAGGVFSERGAAAWNRKTERERPIYSISIVPPPTILKMVWATTCIMMATITLTRGQQRSSDAVRFPGLSSSSMRVSPSSQSSFTNSVCTKFQTLNFCSMKLKFMQLTELSLHKLTQLNFNSTQIASDNITLPCHLCSVLIELIVYSENAS